MISGARLILDRAQAGIAPTQAEFDALPDFQWEIYREELTALRDKHIKPAQREDKAAVLTLFNRALRRSTGWEIHRAEFNEASGWARIVVTRDDTADCTGTVRMVTLMRSTWGGKVSERREVGCYAGGMCSWHLDFSASHLLGCGSHEDFGTALRGLAHYIDDNRAPHALGGPIPSLALMAGDD